jgi:hypothetical protein
MIQHRREALSASRKVDLQRRCSWRTSATDLSAERSWLTPLCSPCDVGVFPVEGRAPDAGGIPDGFLGSELAFSRAGPDD